jgi:hypothetical protein
MSDQSTLQMKAREAMQDGRLPEHEAERRWGGQGVGAPCTICGKVITAAEVEIQLEFAEERDGHPSWADNHLHPACVNAWELECQRKASNGAGPAAAHLFSTGRAARRLS